MVCYEVVGNHGVEITRILWLVGDSGRWDKQLVTPNYWDDVSLGMWGNSLECIVLYSPLTAKIIFKLCQFS